MAAKIIVPLGFVPFQVDRFLNSQEGSPGRGWVLQCCAEDRPLRPPSLARSPMQEGGCQAGHPMQTSRVLILPVPAFTLAAGKPVWDEGFGV